MSGIISTVITVQPTTTSTPTITSSSNTASATSIFTPPSATATEAPNSPLSGSPLSYTIIPLAILAVAAAVTFIIFLRRRRRNGGHFSWTGISDADIERANRNTATRRPVGRGGRQWAVWRTDDGLGLDENGDAPPAYEPKARPGQTIESGLPVRGDTTAALHGSYELDDMRRPDGTTLGSSSSTSPPSSPGPGTQPIAAPAPAHTQQEQEAPPPEYNSVTAGSTPPPPSTPHPDTTAGTAGTTGNTNPSASPLITVPPPAVSFTGRRG